MVSDEQKLLAFSVFGGSCDVLGQSLGGFLGQSVEVEFSEPEAAGDVEQRLQSLAAFASVNVVGVPEQAPWAILYSQDALLRLEAIKQDANLAELTSLLITGLNQALCDLVGDKVSYKCGELKRSEAIDELRTILNAGYLPIAAHLKIAAGQGAAPVDIVFLFSEAGFIAMTEAFSAPQQEEAQSEMSSEPQASAQSELQPETRPEVSPPVADAGTGNREGDATIAVEKSVAEETVASRGTPQAEAVEMSEKRVPDAPLPQPRSFAPAAPFNEFSNAEIIMDIKLNVVARIGEVEMPISTILELGPGSILELQKMVNEPVDLLINNKLIARGEVVVVDEKFGIRIVEIVSRRDRIKSLQ